MDKTALALTIIGWLAIAGGIILGFQNYEIPMGTETTILGTTNELSDKSFGRFLLYASAGIISGLMMFGFAKIIELLGEGNQIKESLQREIKHQYKMIRDKEGA